MQYKLLTSSEDLQYLTKFINAKHTPTYLQGIHFAPNGDAVATDGHHMAVLARSFTWTAESPESFTNIAEPDLTIILDSDAVKLIKQLPAGSVEVSYEPDCNGNAYNVPVTVKHMLTGIQYKFESSYQAYPDYARIVTDAQTNYKTCPEHTSYIALNVDLLQDFTGWHKLLKLKTPDRLRMHMTEKESPILIDNSNQDRLIGVLMPIKWDAVAKHVGD